MTFPKIAWHNQSLFRKPPLLLVILVVFLIGFNVFLNVKIKRTSQELSQLENSTRQSRYVASEFAKKIDLGEKSCPHTKTGNPNAPLKFKLFESGTCPFCSEQNNVLDELLPEYGDLLYGEWYDVITCADESEKYRISGVPTFVFTAQGVEKPPAYGFLDREQLVDYICRVSSQC